jgi:hypothetical protein
LFQGFKEVVSEDPEFEAFFALQNFKNKQWGEYFIVQYDLKWFKYIFLSHNFPNLFASFHISKIRQCLCPQLCQLSRLSPSCSLTGSSEPRAYFKYLVCLLLLNEIAEELLSQAQLLTATLHSIGVVVNFKEE